MSPSRSRILFLAIATGFLWALAWPAIGGFSLVAFVAWLPLLHAERLHDLRNKELPRSFLPYVLVAVFVWNASTSWWFFLVDEPLGTRLASGLSPMCFNTVFMLVPWWLKRMTGKVTGPRMANLGFIFYWLAFEHLHHDWDLQWPWFSIGNVFGNDPHWIQWYAYTGMLGGSLWVLLVTYFANEALVRRQSGRSGMRSGSLFAVALVILPIGASYFIERWVPLSAGRSMEVVVVQPCVDPYREKFGGLDPMVQLDRMLALAEPLMTDSTALVVFPETALQEGATVGISAQGLQLHGLWMNDLERSKSTVRLRQFQERSPHAALLAGMSADVLLDPSEPMPAAARELPWNVGAEHHLDHYVAYNAALFLPAQGPLEQYVKSKLVAGVELMPFERLLSPLGSVSVDLGGTSGSLGVQVEREVLSDPASGLELIPAICYESVFGEHVAAHVRNGGNLIAIITNDAWWSDSPGYKQHLSFARIRAIETRREVVRSANTGISCFVDRRGIVRQATEWWVPTAIRGPVVLAEDITFFVRHGDQVGRVSLFMAALLLLVTFIRFVKSRNI